MKISIHMVIDFRKSMDIAMNSGTVAKRRKQRGFGEEGMKKIYESAGVGISFDFKVIAEGAVLRLRSIVMTADVFMARGQKSRKDNSYRNPVSYPCLTKKESEVLVIGIVVT